MALLTLKFVTDVRDQDYEVVEFHGELDKSTVESTEQQLAELLAHFTRKYIIFDLSDLSFINSEGIGFIVSTFTKLAKKNCKLLLSGAKQNVADIFELVGLPKLLSVFTTVGEAIQFMKK